MFTPLSAPIPSYIDMATNWLCSIKKLGITNYIIYATDEETEK